MLQRDVHLRDYLEILRKHDFVICLSVLLVVGVALVVGVRLPKIYSATTLILFVQSQSTPPVSSTSLFQTVLSGGVDRGEMETVGQRFSTQSMLSSAIESLESDGISAVRHLPGLTHLKQNLTARTRPETRYIELSLRLREDGGGERNAALLVNQLVREMQRMRKREEQMTFSRRQKFLEDKLNELLQQAKQVEASTLQFVRENGSPSVWYPGLTQTLERRGQLLEQQMQLERSLEGTQLEFDFLLDEMERLPTHVKLSETISQDAMWLYQTQKLADLESERTGLVERLNEDSVEVRALDARIEGIKRQLKEMLPKEQVTTVTQGQSVLYTSIQDRLISLQVALLRLKNGLEGIRPQLDAIDREIEAHAQQIPENELSLEKLRREIDALHELQKEVSRQQLQAELLNVESAYPPSGANQHRIEGGMEVVDAAEPQKIPVSPRLKFIVLIAAVIGTIVGLTAALLIEYFGDVYRRPADIQGDFQWAHLGHVVSTQAPALSEDFRTVAANIELAQFDGQKQALMITSSDIHPVTVALAANLAVALASMKASVLVVDCDSQATRLYQRLNSSQSLPPSPTGWQDWENAVQHTGFPHLDIVSPRQLFAEVADFWQPQHLSAFVENLRQKYSCVLFYTPSVLSSADSLILGAHCDAVVLAIAMDSAKKEALRVTHERLSNARIPALGFLDA